MSHILDRLAGLGDAAYHHQQPSPAAETSEQSQPPILVICPLLELEADEVDDRHAAEVKRRNGTWENGNRNVTFKKFEEANETHVEMAEANAVRTSEHSDSVPLFKLGESKDRLVENQEKQKAIRRDVERSIALRHIARADQKENCGSNYATCSTDSVDTFLKSLSVVQNYPAFHENCSYCMEDNNYGKEEYDIFRKAEQPTLGQFLYAVRDIKQDMVVHHEFPIVTLPDTTKKPNSTVCVNCYKLVELNATNSQLRICKGCFWPVCQFGNCDRGVGLHSQLECDFFRSRGVRFANDPSFDFDSFWFLMWKKLKLFEPKKFAEALSLPSGSRAENTTEIFHKVGIIKARAANLKRSDFPNNLVKKIIDIVRLNSIAYRPEFPNPPKYADILYVGTSRLSHSCIPNMIYVHSPNFHVSWIASREIPAGEILTICYNEELLFEPPLVRQSYLYARYNFICECRRCCDPTEFHTYFNSLLCSDCFDPDSHENCGFLVKLNPNIESDGQCNKCGDIIDHMQIFLRLSLLEHELNHLLKGHENTIHDLTEWVSSKLAERSLPLHKNHRLVFKASLNIMAAIRDNLLRSWCMYSEDDLTPYLPYAETVHHIFTTFHPVRRDYRGEILTVVSIIRFSQMTKSFATGTTSLQEVENEFKRCFFRHSDSDNDRKFEFTGMLELKVNGRLKVKGTVEFALSQTLHVITARLIHASKKNFVRKAQAAEFTFIKLTEDGLYQQALKYNLFKKAQLGNTDPTQTTTEAK